MGADLYLDGVNDPLWHKWRPHFEAAVKERDAAADEATRERCQTRVDYCYDMMHSEGYFRDSYNGWNVLWKFGLDWWEDILPRVSKNDGYLLPADCEYFLSALEQQRETFRQAVEDMPEDKRRYFERRAQALEEFLKTAIERKESIRCSL